MSHEHASPDRMGALPAPAALASTLLRWTHRADASALEGDLAEAYHRRRQERGALRAWLWGWHQVVASAVQGARGGFTQGASAGASGRGPRAGLALRLAARGLRRDRATSLLAVLVLALGMAAPTTFASLLRGAMRPLPVPGGERVVRIDVVQPSTGARAANVTGADLEAWRDTRALSAVGGFQLRTVTLETADVGATRVSLAALTADVLPLLNVAPRLGRLPDADEADAGVVLGNELWAEHFQGDRSVLGRVVRLDGESRTVLGVMPAGFAFPFNEQAWLVLAPGEARETPLEALGRLAPGASRPTAGLELQERWTRSAGIRAADQADAVVVVEPFTGGRGEGGEGVAFLGLVLVGLCLLVIAGANVANLLLVRAQQRVRALGIQAALGAGRVQLGLLLLFEALMLALAGGAGGLLLAHVTVAWVQEASQANFGYHWMRMAVDGPVLLAAGGLMLVTGLLAGALPVIGVMRADLRAVLRSDGNAGAARGGVPWGRVFVTTQLALSCAALVAAALTGRSLWQTTTWGSELPAAEVLTARLHVPADATGATGATQAELLRALASQPEVAHAALALGAPGAHYSWVRMELEGRVYERPEDRDIALANAIVPSFFAALDIELLRGRLPGNEYAPDAPAVAVVNESFVRRFMGDGEALGRRVRVPSLDSAWATVVGVVEDVDMGAGPDARLDRVYLALPRLAAPSPMVLLRAGGGGEGTDEAGAMAAILRRVVTAVDPAIAVNQVQSLAALHRYMVRAQATLATLAVAGGLAGLLVAAVGLYGVLAVRVGQRRRELGVRLALGSDGRGLARQVVRWALAPLLPALVLGLAAAWLAGPLLAALLLGGNVRDPVVFGAVAGAFLAVGGLAALVPALRAAGTDPARALRSE